LIDHPQQILSWHLNAGVDEAVGEEPLDRYALATAAQEDRAAKADALLKAGEAERAAAPVKAAKPRSDPAASGPASGPTPVRPAEGAVPEEQVKIAVELAAAAKTVDELRAALEGFDGCPLKKSATNLVFGDGNPNAKIVFVGEAPGADEDRQGVPFVGASGQLLDKMLASIGLDRTSAYIANTVFWRPPGNRSPYPGEVAVCLPFVERLIEIIDPVMVITVGAPATHALLAQHGSVSKLVGRWFTFETANVSHPIAPGAIYHPDILIKTPAYKRQTWQNLLEIRKKLYELRV